MQFINPENSQNYDIDNAIPLEEEPLFSEEIINLEELSKHPTIENTDIILSIIELCSFKTKYNYEISNKNISFWNQCFQKDVLRKIFKRFRPSTLNKYWMIIRKTKNIIKFVNIVKNDVHLLNIMNLRALTTINLVSSYICFANKNQSFAGFVVEQIVFGRLKIHKIRRNRRMIYRNLFKHSGGNEDNETVRHE